MNFGTLVATRTPSMFEASLQTHGPTRRPWMQRLPAPGQAAQMPSAPVIAGCWLVAHTLVLWPHVAWAARRAQDGSDDPMGLTAIVALLTWLVVRRTSLLSRPRVAWLATSVALTVAATAALWWLPALAAAALAAASMATGIAAWLRPQAPRVALAGLVLLALPWMATLQFYAGYPLRVVTAQLSTWALQLAGWQAARSGAAMTVQGQLVIVDAPCSGVQMAWMAYFTACAVAAWTGLRDGLLMRRLPLVGVIVLAGNVLRNTVLVALESRPQGLSAAAHEGVGLLALAVVVGVVMVWVSGAAARVEASRHAAAVVR